MSEEWFVERKTGLSGPYTTAKLRALAAEGKITSADVIRQGAEGRRVSASDFVGLFEPANRPSKASRTPPPIPAQPKAGVDQSDSVRKAADGKATSTPRTTRLSDAPAASSAPRTIPPPLPGDPRRKAHPQLTGAEPPNGPGGCVGKSAAQTSRSLLPASHEAFNEVGRPQKRPFSHLGLIFAGGAIVATVLLLAWLVIASRKRPKPDEFMLNGSSVLASLQDRISKDNQKIALEVKHAEERRKRDQPNHDERAHTPDTRRQADKEPKNDSETKPVEQVGQRKDNGRDEKRAVPTTQPPSIPRPIHLTEEEKEDGWDLPNLEPAPPVTRELYDKLQPGMTWPVVLHLLGGPGAKGRLKVLSTSGRRGIIDHYTQFEVYLSAERPDVFIVLYFENQLARHVQQPSLQWKKYVRRND